MTPVRCAITVLLLLAAPPAAAGQPPVALGPSQAWSHRVGDGTTNFDTLAATAPAPDGGLYVLINRTIVAAQHALAVVRYSPGGQMLWERSLVLNQPENPRGVGVHVDASGNVYAAGAFGGQLGSTVAAASWTADGALRWEQKLAAISSVDVAASGLDASATLRLFGDDGNRWLHWRFDSAGTLLGTATPAFPTGIANPIYHARFHPDGSVFVAHVDLAKTGVDLRVYGTTGGFQRITQVPLGVPRVDDVRVGFGAGSEAFVAASAILVFGNPGLRGNGVVKIDGGGSALWTHVQPNPEQALIAIAAGVRGVEGTPGGGCVVIHESWGSGANQYDIEVQGYSAAGDLDWTRRQMGPARLASDHPAHVVVAGDGRIYVAAAEFDEVGARYVLLALNAEGDVEWMDRSLPSGTPFAERPLLTLGSGGALFFAGETRVPSGRRTFQRRVLTRRFDAPVATQGLADMKLPSQLKFKSLKANSWKDQIKFIKIKNRHASQNLVVTVSHETGAFYAGGVYTVAPGETFKLGILFFQLAAGDYVGDVTVQTSDPANPGGTVHLSGAVK
jgi:hypothetical protein